MEQYVGLDVSLKETSICVVDGSGEIVCETSVGTTPETIAKFIEKRAPLTVRVGLESKTRAGRPILITQEGT